MLVVDTSALISLGAADSLSLVCEQFETHTTETVVAELEDTAAYDDVHGAAAADALERRSALTVHSAPDRRFESSRIDAGEATCLAVARDLEAAFVITDDLRAPPELQNAASATVAIVPLLLRALVKRDVLENRQALDRVETMAEARDWLGTPIYRRAQDLFD